MAMNEGGCSCGEVRYRLSSDPLFVHCCHCLNCQRQTGSAFVINMLIEADRVELLAGEPQPVSVPRDDGDEQSIWRCPPAGSALYSRYGRRRGAVRPRRDARRSGVGLAGRPHLHAVEAALGRRCPESVPAFEVYYDSKKLWPAASLERLQALGVS